MKNFIQAGQVFTLIATAVIKSGDVVVKGELVGIASTDAVVGESVECCETGVYSLPKEAALAMVQGDIAYHNGTEVTALNTDVEIGVVYADADGASSVAVVKLKGGAHIHN